MAKVARSRIDDLLEQQGADLVSLTDREARKFLAVYDDARRELRDALANVPAGQEYSAQRLSVLLAQVEDGHRRLNERLNGALDASTKAASDRALANLLGVIKKAEPSYRDAGNRVETETIRRLAIDQGLALHRYSVERYGAQVIDQVQREIVVGVTRGQSVREIADRIAGTSGVIAGFKGRAELIARMELSRAYNTGAQVSLEEVAKGDPVGDPDPLLKRADEFFDKRNHPFSRALHGKVALPHEEFEVPVSEVPGGKAGLSGLVWKRHGNVVRGFNYPAHFNDRGRQVPHRMSWEGRTYVPRSPTAKRDSPPSPAPAPTPPPANRPGPAPGSSGGLSDRKKPPAPRPAPKPHAPREPKSILGVERQIRGHPEEHLAVKLGDGRMLRTGPEYTRSLGYDPRGLCAVPPSMVNAAKADGRAVLTHNHPSGNPLSPQDFRLASWLNLAECRATRPTGGAWSVKRPPGGWPHPLVMEAVTARAWNLATADASDWIRSLNGPEPTPADRLEFLAQAGRKRLNDALRPLGTRLVLTGSRKPAP